MTYYNTNRESGETLQESCQKTKTQEEMVLGFFQLAPDPWPPHAVRSIVFNNRVPLTSVRRAITNLTLEGKLIKTDTMVMGSHGKMVHTWVAKRDN